MSTGYFDELPGRWDELRESFFSEAVRDKAIARASVEAGRVAVDVGAGTGFVTEGLVRRGLRAIAVDSSRAMLDELRRKLPQSAAVETRLGEAERLPKPGGTLVLTDVDEHGFEFLLAEHHDRWPGFKREDVRRWLEEAGLRDVVVESLGKRCCAESSCGGEQAAIEIFVALGRK